MSVTLSPNDTDIWDNEAETATVLDRHPRTMKRWRDLGEGPPFTRIGRQVFYRRAAVRDWLLNREQAS